MQTTDMNDATTIATTNKMTKSQITPVVLNTSTMTLRFTPMNTMLNRQSEKFQIVNKNQQIRPIRFERDTSSSNEPKASSNDLLKSRPLNKRKLRNASCSPLNSSRVTFGTVAIAEFPVVIGDSPEVPDGCPIALSPVPSEQIEAIPVQTYECHRSNYRSSSRDAWRLSSMEREERLLNAGFSLQEIRQASKVARECRLRRGRSYKQMPWDGVHSLVENTTRGLRKILPTS